MNIKTPHIYTRMYYTLSTVLLVCLEINNPATKQLECVQNVSQSVNVDFNKGSERITAVAYIYRIHMSEHGIEAVQLSDRLLLLFTSKTNNHHKSFE